ncbi:hypothetical protein [Paraglaciecola sp. MB-3u-78]|jgi:hypothetical protein|uniref:hypothetical protein n=1 Tax=Paraglaciecola sp. MB-3u-78 TaxID=2058332 RepID=UPI000C32CE53|nr:hypothetical protein [Paraglaciecola sp. MB-3u-78]PKG93251.1 hypothetical protein CXF95_27115 [Paraglaciecola sp. MB-3u-78]
MEKVVLSILFGAKPLIKQILLVLGLFSLYNPPVFSQLEKMFQVVNAKTIDRNLALQFPIDKTFQGTSATFYDAKILINTLDQSIKLQMKVSSNKAEQSLIAKLVFTGDMQYHPFTESYQLENLLLDSFKIEQDSYSDSQPPIKMIKQSLINDFKDIVLFNLTEITTLSLRRPADEIEISMNQLLFIWH